MSAPAECVCAIRGYCADAPGDPLACPVCVELGPDDDCPAELLLPRPAESEGES